MNKRAAVIGLVVVIAGFCMYATMFAAPEKNAEIRQFSVALDTPNLWVVTENLQERGFVKSRLGFAIAFVLSGGGQIEPGGYQISQAMSAREIAKIMMNEPTLKWVTIHEGLRKEEIAKILADTFKWTDEMRQKWIDVDTTLKGEYIEGVYFPDTYLIPINETPLQVAQRMQARFETAFAPYAQEAVRQNIKWTTVLTMASLIQREAAGKEDMALIAGVLWNRLDENMTLGIDATIQYIRGDIGEGWWAPIKSTDKELVSPYNTYKNKSLPPHPIANPGLDAIEAVLTPEETDCLYYLHDSSKMIHCAKTFEEHKANIQEYLR